ncbi:hypothetical protein [Corynebacterium minutissimum]|uniref:Uncharacterized protein n=1 Tax=Corynebacterium minutissimum TaxID=38301 RepID=A0A376CW62_9CORY|nr:hypothetical protein [Corynebacterium minutissimum]QRP60567.1 hypothetical protein I6J26_10465 [Corynebacterium minutissimum]STC76333.1 Uncharacterised protein [Corynebacterium minutissimum]
MNLADIHAFMLGYIEAAIKEQIDPKEVDELFAEAEAVARKTLKKLNQSKNQ